MENIEKIESFRIDHDILEPGFYISRRDGDIITYDLRTRKPNCGNYMDNATMHSVEHMFATLIRNSEIADKVIYFGPMGCQTGFYLLVKDLSPDTVFACTKQTVEAILDYEGPVFGASAKECGNYRNLSLSAAKEELRFYLEVLNKKEDSYYGY